MRTFKSFQKSAPPRAVAGLTFAVALLGTVGCTAAPVQDPAPQIDAVAGQQFTGVVDSFTDTNADATTHYAFVDWGDSQFSEVTVAPTGTGTVYDVSGSNTYQAAGDYSATVYFLGGQSANTALADLPSGTPSQDQANTAMNDVITAGFVNDQLDAAMGTVPVRVSETPELDSLVLFGTALMGAGGSAFSRRWVPLLRLGKLRRQPSS